MLAVGRRSGALRAACSSGCTLGMLRIARCASLLVLASRVASRSRRMRAASNAARLTDCRQSESSLRIEPCRARVSVAGLSSASPFRLSSGNRRCVSRVSRSGQSGAPGRVWSACVGSAAVVSLGVGPHTRGRAGVAGCRSPFFRSPTVLISYGWALVVDHRSTRRGCRGATSGRHLSNDGPNHSLEPCAQTMRRGLSLSSALFRARIFNDLIDSYRNCCIPSLSTQIDPQPIQLRCLDIISSRSISSRSLHERRDRHVVTAASPASPTPASPISASPTSASIGARSARFQAVARHSTDRAHAAPASALRV